jgi:hypothetical protein
MSNPDNQHDQALVVDAIDHAVISNSDSPKIGLSRELDGAGRPRIILKCVYGRHDPF